MKFRQKRQSVLNVNRRILKIFPYGVTLPQNHHFGVVFDGSPCDRATGQGGYAFRLSEALRPL